MNQISVFGATGRTGRLFVDLALNNGYGVKALVRDSSKLDLQHPNLEVIQGDAFDLARVADTIKATDAVIDLIGTDLHRGKRPPPDFRRTSTQNILSAMQQNNVKRLIIVPSIWFGAMDERDKPNVGFKFMVFITKSLLGAAVKDGEARLDLIKRSELDWTIVRAPTLSDQPSNGNYRVVSYVDASTSRIAKRSDVAAFLIDVLKNGKYVKQMPLISS